MKKFDKLVNELAGHVSRFAPPTPPDDLYEVEISSDHELDFFELLRYGQDVLDAKLGGRVQILRTFSRGEILRDEEGIYHSDEDGSSILFDSPMHFSVADQSHAPISLRDRKMGIFVQIEKAY